MNRSQRIVLVVALAVLALVVDRAFLASSVQGGWYGYAANTVFSPAGMEPGRQVLLRLFLLLSWTLLSMRLLRDEAGGDDVS